MSATFVAYRAEKESTMLKAEIDDISNQMEHVTRVKVGH